MLRMGDQTW